MSEAEGNGPAFPRALMALKNKCHLKGRLLKRFLAGFATDPLPSGQRFPPRMPGVASIGFGWRCPFYFPLSRALSGIFSLTTQPCEIRSVLLSAPNIPRQTDLHQVQTVTNLELFFPISAAPFPSRCGDLPCCSLRLLSRCSVLFVFSSSCPTLETEGEAKAKKKK